MRRRRRTRSLRISGSLREPPGSDPTRRYQPKSYLLVGAASGFLAATWPGRLCTRPVLSVRTLSADTLVVRASEVVFLI